MGIEVDDDADEYRNEVFYMLEFAQSLADQICEQANLDYSIVRDLGEPLDFLRFAQLPEHNAAEYDGNHDELVLAASLLHQHPNIGIDTMFDIADAASCLECAWQEFRIDPTDADAEWKSEETLYLLARALAACAVAQDMLNPQMTRTQFARAGARARHADNYVLKSELRAYYIEHSAEFTSLDDAAEKMAGKVFPVKFRTARTWLTGLSRRKSSNEPQ